MSQYQKTKLISVDEAVNRGRRMLLLPRILLIAGLFFFLLLLALLFMALTEGPPIAGKIWLIILAVLAFSFILFFYLPFLFWSKQTTRWKLWAFDNVDNVHELKIVAVEAHLYAAYGTLMDKLQIQSATEREQWRCLQQRNNFPEVFIDDPAIPPETQIYYSKPQLILDILLGLFISSIGTVTTYLGFRNDATLALKILGMIIALFPWYMIIATFKNLLNHEPQLILGNKGLYTAGSGLVPWDVIYDEEVKKVTYGRRGVKYTLHFKYPGGFVNLEVTQFAISRNNLQKLMRVYKGRYNASAH